MRDPETKRWESGKYGYLLTDAESIFLFWEIFEIMFADWDAEPIEGLEP